MAGHQLVGWVAFLLCAVVLLVAAVRDRDVLSIVASVLFLLGCLAFLAPLVGRDATDE